MADTFRLKFTIEGVPELERILIDEMRKVTNFREPLTQAAKFIRNDVEINFMTEGGLAGGWEALKKPTIKSRIRAGYGGAHPILQRTGALRRSFYSLVDEKKAIISSKSPYFVYHQSRQPRTTELPRRAMLVLVEHTRQNIIEAFHKFLRFK